MRRPGKITLPALAWHADQVEGLWHPGLSRLPRFTGLSRWSVARAIRFLEDRGAIETVREHRKSTFSVVRFDIRPDQFGSSLLRKKGAARRPAKESSVQVATPTEAFREQNEVEQLNGARWRVALR